MRQIIGIVTRFPTGVVHGHLAPATPRQSTTTCGRVEKIHGGPLRQTPAEMVARGVRTRNAASFSIKLHERLSARGPQPPPSRGEGRHGAKRPASTSAQGSNALAVTRHGRALVVRHHDHAAPHAERTKRMKGVPLARFGRLSVPTGLERALRIGPCRHARASRGLATVCNPSTTPAAAARPMTSTAHPGRPTACQTHAHSLRMKLCSTARHWRATSTCKWRGRFYRPTAAQPLRQSPFCCRVPRAHPTATRPGGSLSARTSAQPAPTPFVRSPSEEVPFKPRDTPIHSS